MLAQPLNHSTSQSVLPFGVRKSDVDQKTVHFGRKFGMDHMLASALANIAVHCLERDKQYEAASLVFTQLLLKRQVKAVKRGTWWVRLAIDLKHLKLKKDCLRMTEVALRDV